VVSGWIGGFSGPLLRTTDYGLLTKTFPSRTAHGLLKCNPVDTHWNKLHSIAQAEVESILGALPGPLQKISRSLPVIYQGNPEPGEPEHNYDPDLLGLFVGLPLAESESGVLSAHIVLFLENLWDEAEADEEIYRREVRTTFLHELGHYLGLDEDQLMERGL
jgi:predicted Zn-dependent protease with MMP-like domain